MKDSFDKFVKTILEELGGGMSAASGGAVGSWAPDTYGGKADARVPARVGAIMRRGMTTKKKKKTGK